MSDSESLFERVRRARIVQVLAVYLGASWVVLQIADVLQDAVGLPQWVSGFAVLLLLIGLVIILATAWVQSLPSTDAREQAGEIPTDWQVAPAQAIESLKSGQLPHLTWGRAILGGIVALSLLFGGAGLYVGLTGGPGVLGPREVGAGEASEGIAVVPFTVTGGEELDLWREGMANVLTTNLDGMGGFRTIDSRTVMARWRDQIPEGQEPDLRAALEVAARTGARYALVGDMVGNPAGVRISADLYDLSTGEEVAQVTQEGSADEVLELTSALSVDLTRELISASGRETVQDVRLAALTTTSLPALRAYLQGEAAFRSADFAAAVADYEQAVELDSLFALAWLRLSNSYGWLDDIASTAGARAGERAVALLDRLPARDRLLVQASEAVRNGDADFYDEVQEAVRLYPDDPDLWFELGEFAYHVGMGAGVATETETREAFERAVALDPNFGPYHVHLLELIISGGDREAAEEALEFYSTSTRDARNVTEFSIVIPLLLGDDQEAADAVAAALEEDQSTVGRIRVAFAGRQDRWDRMEMLLWATRNRAGAQHAEIVYTMGAQGKLDRVARLVDTLNIASGDQGVAAGWLVGSWETAKDTPLRDLADPSRCEEPVVNTFCQMFVGWGLARSGDVEGARESLRFLRQHAAEREGASAELTTLRADVVEGTLAAEAGRVDEARRFLGPVVRGAGIEAEISRNPLARVEWAEGNVPEAIGLLRGNLYSYARTASTYDLARLHDERGDTEQARAFYRSFVTMTRAGDPDLPEIVQAREALERLGG